MIAGFFCIAGGVTNDEKVAVIFKIVKSEDGCKLTGSLNWELSRRL
jgi:hypothetical protein